MSSIIFSFSFFLLIASEILLGGTEFEFLVEDLLEVLEITPKVSNDLLYIFVINLLYSEISDADNLDSLGKSSLLFLIIGKLFELFFPETNIDPFLDLVTNV